MTSELEELKAARDAAYAAYDAADAAYAEAVYADAYADAIAAELKLLQETNNDN